MTTHLPLTDEELNAVRTFDWRVLAAARSGNEVSSEAIATAIALMPRVLATLDDTRHRLRVARLVAASHRRTSRHRKQQLELAMHWGTEMCGGFWGRAAAHYSRWLKESREELLALVHALYADDKPRHRAIRRAARFLVEHGYADEQVHRLANMIDP